MKEHPRKRSNPAQLTKEMQAIVEDMESRLPPDSESPESVQRREKRSPPPVVRGGRMIGFKKNTSPV